MSLNFIGGGVGGYILGDFHTLCMGEILEQLSTFEFSVK